mgnify:CR=1 FL=1
MCDFSRLNCVALLGEGPCGASPILQRVAWLVSRRESEGKERERGGGKERRRKDKWKRKGERRREGKEERKKGKKDECKSYRRSAGVLLVGKRTRQLGEGCKQGGASF